MGEEVLLQRRWAGAGVPDLGAAVVGGSGDQPVSRVEDHLAHLVAVAAELGEQGAGDGEDAGDPVTSGRGDERAVGLIAAQSTTPG
jgi:hypothetical protein